MSQDSKKDDLAKLAVEEALSPHVPAPWPADVPSQEILWDMRRNGMPKPSHVPMHLWNNLQKISFNHENVADLMLLGHTKKEIAEKLGLSASGVSLETRTPTFKAYYAERRRERQRELSRDGITDLLDVAIDTAGEIMQKADAKDATRLDAAKYIIDQSLGKAKQEVKVESTNLLAATIARIDELKKLPASATPEFLAKEPNKFDDFMESLESGTLTNAAPPQATEETLVDGEE